METVGLTKHVLFAFSDGMLKLPAKHALDDEQADRLWAITEEIMTGKRSVRGPLDQ